jgi:hypothetical protein
MIAYHAADRAIPLGKILSRFGKPFQKGARLNHLDALNGMGIKTQKDMADFHHIVVRFWRIDWHF